MGGCVLRAEADNHEKMITKKIGWLTGQSSTFNDYNFVQ